MSADDVFRLNYSFWSHYGPEVDSASNRNEYEKRRPAREADNLTAICEPIV
jgi:hypothetical protein